MPRITIYRLPAVLEVTGLSKATIYRLLDRDEFPPRVQLSRRCVGWRVADIEAWLDERAARTASRRSEPAPHRSQQGSGRPKVAPKRR